MIVIDSRRRRGKKLEKKEKKSRIALSFASFLFFSFPVLHPKLERHGANQEGTKSIASARVHKEHRNKPACRQRERAREEDEEQNHAAAFVSPSSSRRSSTSLFSLPLSNHPPQSQRKKRTHVPESLEGIKKAGPKTFVFWRGRHGVREFF
jgi:hypothetical protein